MCINSLLLFLCRITVVCWRNNLYQDNLFSFLLLKCKNIDTAIDRKFYFLQGEGFPTGLGIRSFAHSFIAHLLIRSFCSNQMSDCEQFTQIAQDKWATLSKSLRWLRGNERPWANRSGHTRQMSDHEQFAQATLRKWANEPFAQKMLVKKSKIFLNYVLFKVLKIKKN